MLRYRIDVSFYRYPSTAGTSTVHLRVIIIGKSFTAMKRSVEKHVIAKIRNCVHSMEIAELKTLYECAVITNEDESSEKIYRGATENEFKARYPNHVLSFNNGKYKNITELSKYIWKLKDEKKVHSLKWRILKKSQAYRNGSKRCNLCLTEKLMIISADPSKLLNKRSELISKCRHENKFYVKNYKTSNNDDSQMNSAGTSSRRVSLETNVNSVTQHQM